MTTLGPPESKDYQHRRMMGNTLWLTFSSLGAKILAYAQFLLVVRTFSAEQVGIYAVCLTGVLFAELLANLGLDRVIVREVALRGKKESTELFDNALFLKALASIGAYALCLVAFWQIYPEIVEPHGFALAIFLAYVPVCALARSFESHFIALEQMAVPAIGQFLERIVMLLVAVAAWLGWCGFDLFLIIFPLGAVVRLLIPGVLFYVQQKTKGPHKLSRVQAKSLLAESSWLFGVEILAIAYFRIDIFILSKMVDLRGTGLYQAAHKIFDFGIAMFAGYLTAIFPAMARDKSRLQPSRLFLGAAIVLVCFSLPGIIFRHEILMLFKPEYVEAAPVLACLLLTLPLVYFNSLLVNFAVASLRMRTIFFVAMPMLGVSIGLNLGLIPRYGILGGALATFFSEFFSSIALLVTLKPFALKASPTPAMCG